MGVLGGCPASSWPWGPTACSCCQTAGWGSAHHPGRWCLRSAVRRWPPGGTCSSVQCHPSATTPLPAELKGGSVTPWREAWGQVPRGSQLCPGESWVRTSSASLSPKAAAASTSLSLVWAKRAGGCRSRPEEADSNAKWRSSSLLCNCGQPDVPTSWQKWSLTFHRRQPPVLSQGHRGLEEEPGPHLLLEVAPLLLVYQHQVEVIAHRELLVDVPHGGRELIPCQEEPDRDGLSCRRKARVSTVGKVTHSPLCQVTLTPAEMPLECSTEPLCLLGRCTRSAAQQGAETKM